MSETVQTENNQPNNGIRKDEDTIIVDTYQPSANSDKNVNAQEVKKEQPIDKPQDGEQPVADEQNTEEQPKVETPELTSTQLPAELQRFQDSYVKNGKLTDADYADLQKMGLPKAVVDDHIKMRQRLAALEGETVAKRVATEEATLLNTVGGKEEFAKVREWAANKLSDAEKKAFNSIVNGSDFAAKQIALDGLISRYKSAQPKEPRLVTGQRASEGVKGYESRSEWLKDMSDPKYKNDPAFRSNVEKRMARSDIY